MKKYFWLMTTLLTIGTIFLFSNATKAQENNQINNPSLEEISPTNANLPKDWQKDKWGTNKTVFTYPVPGMNENSKAVKVQISNYFSGDAKWYFKEVPVLANTIYEFSDFYMSNTSSNLVAKYTIKTSTRTTVKYVDLINLNSANTWTKSSVTFTTPTNAVSMTILHLIKKNGYLITDEYFLGPVTSPTPTSSPTSVPTSAPTSIITQPPTATPTTTIVDTPTSTPILIPTDTPTPVVTNTPTIIINPTDTPTTGVSVTPTPTMVDTPAPTSTPTSVITQPPIATPTPIIVDTPTSTPILIPTDTPTPVVTNTPTIIPTATPVPTNNLVLNSSLEEVDASGLNPNNWLNGYWGTNTSIFTYSNNGHLGTKSATVDVTSYTSGDAKWYFQDVAVQPGQQYAISDYYKSNIQSRIVVRFAIANQTNFSYIELAVVPSSVDWQQMYREVTAPSGATSMTVFHLISQVGFLTIDDALVNKIIDIYALNEGLISFDFDDGWLSTYNNAIPILNTAGFKSTQYIITSYMGGEPGYVTAAQVLNMKNIGHEIGSHTRTHAQLPLLNTAQLKDEVSNSVIDLNQIGINPLSIAYPYGEYDANTIQAVNNAGFLSARTALMADSGFNRKNTNPYLLKTQGVEVNTSIETIKSWIDIAITSKTWLILVFHQVDNSGTQYSISPTTFQTVVDYVKLKNTRVVTVSEGLFAISH